MQHEYISAEIALRIKLAAKSKGLTVATLLEKVNLGRNTMANLKTSMPKADNLAKIADYLDCSVDYLLGRTNEQNVSANYSNNNITNSNNVSLGENSPVYNHSDEISSEIAKIVSSLDLRQQTELLTIIYKFYDKCTNTNNEEKKYTRFVAARSENGQSPMRFEEVSKELYDDLMNAPETDLDL